MAPLNIDIPASQYHAMLGVGGVGSGVFFALDGDHTLGREESRGGRFLERRDYCKLHIISHYVATLLGEDFTTIPIGKLGSDAAGLQLVKEMKSIHLDMRYIQACHGEQTLYSLCLVYPDGSGGNLTVDDSACNKVDPVFVASAEAEFIRFRGKGIALAAPEVPLEAREKLLQLATQYNFYRVASFVSAEMRTAIEMGMLGMVDLLAINLDEAAAAAGIKAEAGAPLSVMVGAVHKLHRINPEMVVSITAGRTGSWTWDGKALHHLPAYPGAVVGTTGAGDAFLAGMIAGQVANLNLCQMQELAGLVATFSITSPHTIHPGLERCSLLEYVEQNQISISEPVRSLLLE
jgi:sugar/nucleoside kinase (ribokinase family)